ncbi:leucyl aminopeptidase [Stella humosa]|uniref:Leucyl aminopeptidase n=1 Tax=Stella humosa TaxID=94 RepID=A0A3N1M7X2_9PROT|nr:leucyl aminopeptidase family protein [Stella humosa]ROP99832.1 leucyl aminopeptidase [Stella humosa]BBK30940.1 leucyl aminopeptidase [Stella humosa]
MSTHSLIDGAAAPIRLVPVAESDLAAWLEAAPASLRQWATANALKGEAGRHLAIPGADGAIDRIVVVYDPAQALWALGSLPLTLPEGDYSLEGALAPALATDMAAGWALGAYAFTRYRKARRQPARLVWPAAADRGEATRIADAIWLVRDLVNTPAEDLGPGELADAAVSLAKRHGAEVRVLRGDELLAQNYPMVHAVGRGSVRPPCLVDITWGDPSAPKVTLVGKGVCFDSGGYDLKPAAGMKLMKKDMGGGANVLGLASLLMAGKRKIRLRVLLPTVENLVSGNAFKPMDIIPTRKGLTIEIGNTDAEGRLILCDPLAEGDSEKPAILIDMATLTGAARVAVGPDLPAMFCNDDKLAADIQAASTAVNDPVWRMPLWKPYRKWLDSKIADMNNVSESPFAGSITAALYLQEFVSPTTPWVHFDMYAWNASARPGRPEGGEAQAIRALDRMIGERFG